MSFLFFLVQVLGISCSGAMQPGPVTATAIAMGTRNRYAGTLIAIGHGIIEFPLIVVIILGMGEFLKMRTSKITIGLAGGIFLLLMAIQSLMSIKTTIENQSKVLKDKPILAGIILSAGNPYFLIWWATVGLALATQATQWGIWAFAIFAVTHWSVDLIWLQLLTWCSNKGSVLLGPKGMKIVLIICSGALFFFGLFFIYKAIMTLIR